jgi:hypothetical protein
MSASLLPFNSAEKKTSARAWKLTAHLCSEAHPGIYNPCPLVKPALSAEYVRDLLLAITMDARAIEHHAQHKFIYIREAAEGAGR